jgi:hypothetical protein
MEPRRNRPDYGWPHQKARARVARLVASGLAVCWRCGQQILATEPWDLGHVDGDPTRYAGPEHRRCNRATASRTRNGRRVVDLASYPEDDPANGVFWGPPESSGRPRRWSRSWTDWRERLGELDH